jgi:hypothetical protein
MGNPRYQLARITGATSIFELSRSTPINMTVSFLTVRASRVRCDHRRDCLLLFPRRRFRLSCWEKGMRLCQVQDPLLLAVLIERRLRLPDLRSLNVGLLCRSTVSAIGKQEAGSRSDITLIS